MDAYANRVEAAANSAEGKTRMAEVEMGRAQDLVEMTQKKILARFSFFFLSPPFLGKVVSVIRQDLMLGAKSSSTRSLPISFHTSCRVKLMAAPTIVRTLKVAVFRRQPFPLVLLEEIRGAPSLVG